MLLWVRCGFVFGLAARCLNLLQHCLQGCADGIAALAIRRNMLTGIVYVVREYDTLAYRP